MSLAEKLTTIAENTPKVFNAGYEKCKGEQINVLDYAGTLGSLFKLNFFPIQTELEVSFGKKATAVQTTLLNSVFYHTLGIKSIKIVYEGNKNDLAFSMAYAFEGNPSTVKDDFLETIDLSGMPQPIRPIMFDKAFYIRKKLKNIIGEFDLSQTTSVWYTFGVCNALETVRFTPNTIKLSISFSGSPNLTDESIQAIIDGLADLTGQEAETLSVHPIVFDKITSNEDLTNAITNKNWTIQ